MFMCTRMSGTFQNQVYHRPFFWREKTSRFIFLKLKSKFAMFLKTDKLFNPIEKDLRPTKKPHKLLTKNLSQILNLIVMSSQKIPNK